MSQTQGLIFDSGYQPRPTASPAEVDGRSVRLWPALIVVLAALAAFAPSLVVGWVADVREPSPASCVAGAASGVAESAAARRVMTEAIAAGHDVSSAGRC